MKKKGLTIGRMFLWRQGLRMKADEHFVDKFIEFYQELYKKNKNRVDKGLDRETANVLINSICETIIHCLDFGYDVWLGRTIMFTQKIADYSNNYTIKYLEKTDIKKVAINLFKRLTLRLKKKINENNIDYQNFIEEKKKRHQEIKDYYKEFYGEENWWTKPTQN